LMQKRFSK